MKPSVELRTQANKFESGELKWVNHVPWEDNEACLLVTGDCSALSARACDFLYDQLHNQVSFIAGISEWNDHRCRDSAEAIVFLRNAASLAEAAGE